MALEKKNISISFAQGLDTKNDPNQVLPGNFLSLQNVVFGTGMEFNKRNGYQQLAAIGTSAINAATFRSELIAFSSSSLVSYSPALGSDIDKGKILGVDLSTTSIYRSATAQTTQDCAFHSSGVYLHVWADSVNGAQYMVTSAATGNQILGATSLVSTAIYPRAWAIGKYLVITYVDTANNHLKYVSIPVTSVVASNPVDISTQVNGTNRFYDGAVVSNSLYLSWNGSDGGGAVRTTYLDAQLNQHVTIVQSGESASSCITVFIDTVNAHVWTIYCNGAQIKYFILSVGGLSTVLSPTLIVGSLSTINNLMGFASAGSGQIFYQTQNTYSYNSVRSDFISSVTASSVGVVGSPSVFLRGVGLISKPFQYNLVNYFVVAYGGKLEPTYFVVNQTGVVVGKIAYSNGGGYTSNANLTNVNQLAPSQFQFAYLVKDLLETQQGQVYTQTGVNSAILDFNTNTVFQTVELGNNLNINGGFLWSYDGYGPTEQNFHLFPEDLGYTTGAGSTGINPNTYNYIALYEWVDNQGNTHRSGYGTPLVATVSTATTGVTVNIPTLRLTQKQSPRTPVNITLYRDAPSIATGIYYRTSSISSPKFNDTTIDSVQITDTTPDDTIIGNPLLYTTGNVVPNSGGPASIGMVNYKNRLFLIDAENRNVLWYSKTTLQSTPVELSDEFTEFVDPRFGVMGAISVMDDKLIIFKSNAIFYQTGDGPDATGANNDLSEPVFVTSVVGCTNPKSIILTQDGLMFQSNKGIWLLDRGLSVSYIGAPVEQFNASVITSANLVPNTTQVRFTLDSGICLVYDYFYKVWGTFTNHSAAGAVIFQNLFTYVTPTGSFLQETPGVYTDAGRAFYMSMTLGWLSMSGLQGFQRAYRLYLFGKFLSPHILTVSVAYDFNSNFTQSVVIKPTDLNNPTYGNDPFYGASQYYGGSAAREQYRINLDRQKCQSIQIRIEEGTDTSNPVYGASIALEAIALLVGSKGTYPRLPPTQIVD
jgi:hypothetical protein